MSVKRVCGQLVVLYYLISAVCSLSAVSPGNHNQIVNYLRDLGYLPETTEGSHVDYTSAIPSAIESFQAMARLPITGELDEKTVEMMNEPRCGVKDPVNVAGRSKRYAHSGSKWRSNLLQWRITEFSSQFSHVQIIELLKRAFNEWSSVTNLYFEYKPAGHIDIEVKFTSGNHNDGYRFDGLGGVLAHAFFPPQSDSELHSDDIAGDLHFDDEEKWTVNINSDGKNLLQVAVHEIGHSLGLQHSTATDSVMWPWSKHSTGNEPPKFAYDDILAIQTLYGGRRRRYQRDEHTDMLCRHSVDAIFRAIDNKIYLFTGNTVLRLNSHTFEQIGEARAISSVFPGVPAGSRIDGAITPKFMLFSATNSYLFIGDKCYRYSLRNNNISLDNGYPYTIVSRWNIADSNFDSVFNLRNRNTIVFVKGSQYWIHSGTNIGSYGGYPKSLSVSRHMSRYTGFKAAFLHSNGTNYFFANDDRVYAFNPDPPSHRLVC